MYSTHFLDLPPLRSAGGTVTLPGSKSISNRVLLLAALSEGETTIHDLLDSDDTRVMLTALDQLGCGVEKLSGQTVKVRGALSSNDGATATAWAVDGHGILMRSYWDIAPLLHSGQLQRVLPQWSLPPADVYLVYPSRSDLSAKMRALSDFLAQTFSAPDASAPALGGP